ncbi:uncharacterized protein LOC128021130 [Carassius gibelio]|uniref:uncharacterized protein LOC128021130 n=1 Tax=Carassius gibelio TaxID=101364 RepID=UPI0022797F5D|nr:uncharacterized protein LOC128021130 [Carassius gibelio]
MKRAKVEIEGYLHDVSEILEGADHHKYFTALIQEAERNSRVVVFDLQRHDVFRSAEKDRTPVRLCNVDLSPSRQRSGEVDVIVSTASLLRCVRQLNFVFDESSHDVVNDVTVQHILQEGREYQRVNVTIKVLQLSEDRQGMTRSHQRMARRSYDVADQTNSVSLTVWGGDGLQVGKWYRLTNTSIRKFGGCTCLSTTAQSKITIVPDVSCTVAHIMENFDRKEGEIITAEVKVEYVCPRQHPLPSVNLATSLTRCQQCDAFCRTSRVVSVLRGIVTIEDSSGKMNNFVLDDFLLRKLLNVPSGSTPDPDVLVMRLLGEGSSHLHVKFRGQRVLDVAFVADVNTTSSSSVPQSTECKASSSNMGDDLSDDLMLQEIFSEVQTEESANLDAEEKDEGCVEKQEGSNTSEGSVGKLTQERREEVLGVVAEECRKGSQKGVKAKSKK